MRSVKIELARDEQKGCLNFCSLLLGAKLSDPISLTNVDLMRL